MKITRGKLVTELTWSEMKDAHDELERIYLREDVLQVMEDDEELSAKASEGDISAIVELSDRYINHNDAYFDAYWRSIENAIKDHFEEKEENE